MQKFLSVICILASTVIVAAPSEAGNNQKANVAGGVSHMCVPKNWGGIFKIATKEDVTWWAKVPTAAKNGRKYEQYAYCEKVTCKGGISGYRCTGMLGYK
ncbi:MAG: hypothetical protein RLZZ76_610 [Candidatus Parcubacteria bacterium]|jgi:hypothetical protein